jgi:hypothetical protein
MTDAEALGGYVAGAGKIVLESLSRAQTGLPAKARKSHNSKAHSARPATFLRRLG